MLFDRLSRFALSCGVVWGVSTLSHAAHAKDDGGMYADLLGLGMFGTESTHEWKNECPFSDPTFDLSCDVRSPLGIGAGARLGYGFGLIGLEGFAIGTADWSRASINGLDELGVDVSAVPSYLRDMQIGRVGGGFGGGLRLMTPDVGLRLSAGVGGGIALRHIYSNVSSLEESAAGYAAPMLLGDVTLTIGGFLSLGAFAWVEFVDSVAIRPDFSGLGPAAQIITSQIGEEVVVFEGPQVFVGPLLSLHFGN